MTDQRLQKEILGVVRGARLRWRARVGLRGAAFTAGLTLAALVASAMLLERLRFDPSAVLWLRIFCWGVLLASSGWFLVRPLLRRVTDRQVALYLEEHEPTLDHALVSALEAGTAHAASPALTRRLSGTALDRARRVEYGRRVERTAIFRLGGALSALAASALLLAVLGPAHLRSGLSALLLPLRDAETVSPYAIGVTPGSVTISRGADQMVAAVLSGFEAGDATVFIRTGPEEGFQRLSMIPTGDGGFEALLLGVGERTEYFVEATGVRSPTFVIEVADLPYVAGLELTYRFPSYTGLPPRTVVEGGDVVALPGTVVEVRITPTLPSPGGRLVLSTADSSALATQEDGTLLGSFTVEERGFWAVHLARDNGALVPASPEYAIDLLTDNEPTVRFTRPGRDGPASPIEEVYLELEARDDYGVAELRIVYSVNGGPEDTLTVFRGRGAPLAEVSAGHTLFLEEWPLEPGDLVSYYGIARDNSLRGGKTVSTDMYFLNIRPFERAYRQGEQQGGAPPPGGMQGGNESGLSELQRQIIAATFNLVRQRGSYAPREFSENVVSVALSQGRLQEQVGTLVERMRNRGIVETDPGFRDVSAILVRAGEAMEQARARLDLEELQEAIPHEQSALRFLQQAEETYERYVVEQQEQQQGGGGGGGHSAAAEDLADLFELELDKLRNQYETVRRGQQQTVDDQVDATLEKLRELARRQEAEAERQRRRAQAGQGTPQGGSAAQRQLAEEAEEAARQLQRLARERRDAELEDAARRLQDAAESMRRSAAASGNSAASEAGSALERLEEARRRLRQAREERPRRDAEEALRQVDELTRQQREVQRDVRQLPESGPRRASEIARLRERKDQMTEAVQGLERELDRAASVARADQPDAARRLQDAAEQIRESKLKEKLQYSRGTIEQWDPQSATTLEMNIEADLRDLRERIQEAAEAASERTENPLERALDDARSLVRGMEGMDRRLREAGQQGEAGQPGAEPGEPQGGRGQRGGEPTRPGENVQPGGDGATRGDPRRLTPDEARQMRRELAQRSAQARDLRDRLDASNWDTGDLTAVLQAMERLQREGTWSDPAQVALLQDEVLQALKRLEFGLRRQVEGVAGGRSALAGSDDVPDAYRRLVEEYYRKLAGSGGTRPPTER